MTKKNVAFDTFFKTIPLSFAWLPIYLTKELYSLHKTNYEHLDCIFDKKEPALNKHKEIKSIYLFGLSILFLLGSLIELHRNEYMLWIESFICLSLIMQLFWINYRHRNYQNQCIIEPDLNNIELLINPKYFIKMISINTILMTLFTVSLLIFMSCNY